MDLGLRGKVALVTAASRGIGRAIADALAAEGVALAIVSNEREEIQRVAAAIVERHGVEVLPLFADLTRSAEVQGFVEKALERFGRADILVNVAGNMPPGRLHELTDEQWAQAFELKFMAAVRASRAVMPTMRRQGSGVIISMSGGAGWEPLPHQLTQGAVNAAVINFTRALSREAAAEGVRVNAIAPGPTDTDRFRGLTAHLAADQGITLEEARSLAVADVPDGRPGRPEEVAAAVVFLASQQAAHINGIVLEVDGGQMRGLH